MRNNALDDIIRENASRLRVFVRRRVRSDEDADDIVQDTFFQFMRTISILDSPVERVSSWLYTVARNMIINHGKKHRETAMSSMHLRDSDHVMADLSEIMVADDNDNPDMSMLRKMVWDELDKALNELPEEQREAVVMTEIQGLSVKDAAQEMGVSVNTFISRKHYAVVHIRKRLHGLYIELISPDGL